ncbi:hypothetical protein PR202_gb05638 [Eleusine coracana subsp. coracana]|uniref:F-box domain-containing protein n=1 Tax=Eleusine coracana subsp. coracana TaxID=191504 RepID=A0AAV5E779_ELECO|nr:hypothetical protein PR202_gb05638 [Eleusine coracana subsp. coracana]
MYWFHPHERQEQILACLPTHAVVRRATLSAAAVRGLHGQEDRLSALPDDLRRKIVSRLPIKDAVRTTALAHGWRRIWHSTPLSLYDAHLLPTRGTVRAVNAGIIDSVLTGHPGPFSAVYLENCFSRGTRLAKWSSLLAERGVQDLVLVNLHLPESTGRGPSSMCLPANILHCNNLRRLYLCFWEFPDTSNLPDGAGVFPYLEELGIMDTRMEGSDLDHMLASSPELKKLALIGGESPKQAHLFSQSLQCVLFWLSSWVKLVMVDAPSLERLILWPGKLQIGETVIKVLYLMTDIHVHDHVRVCPELVHQLIGSWVALQVDTEVRPSSMIPSVKILALKVDLSGITKVQMMANFLRCFPNIETLHVECDVPNKLTGNNHVEFLENFNPLANKDVGFFENLNPIANNDIEFFENLNPIECVQSQIKKVVLHKFRGHQTEMALLRYLSQTANQMQQLTLVMLHLPDEISEGAIKVQLADLVIPPWASEACTLLLLGPAKKLAWTFHRASDLSIHDPFLSDDGQELFRFIIYALDEIGSYQCDVPNELTGNNHVEFLENFNPLGNNDIGFFENLNPIANNDIEFFENLNPIECVQSQIKKVVLHKFRGHQTEMALLRYLSQTANQMQQLTLVMLHLPHEISEGAIKVQLADLVIPPWASEACTLLLLGPAKKLAWTFHRASDLSIHDPFLSDDGQELFRFVKEI